MAEWMLIIGYSVDGTWTKTSGVLCDSGMNMKLKSKVYKAVVGLAMLYGTETWPIEKDQERKKKITEEAEMRMFR